MAIQHEFAWSVSRHGTFDECRRRFYYDYFLAWRGWEERGDPERRRAYLLKKMTRMPMHAGDCLHVALERWFALRAEGDEPEPAGVLEHALERLRGGYRDSRDGNWRRRPSKITHLAEHHYAEDVVDEPSGRAGEYGKRYVERIRDGLRFFFEAPELEPVRAAEPDSWLACEELGTIELFRTKVYAVPDFAFRDAEGRVHIYDWKSGAPRDADRFQLALYALYAEQKWEVDPTEVVCVDAYLPRGELVECRFDGDELETVLGRVHASITAMREDHFDADAEKGDPERFPPIPEDAEEARACRRCNYRELCAR